MKKPFNKCEDIIKYIKKVHFKGYEKNINAYVSLKDRIETAITNADWLMNQNRNDIERGTKIYDLTSYTDVHILVQKLLDPESIK